MKVKATYIFELPDDLHGDDVEEILKDNGASISAKLVMWDIN